MSANTGAGSVDQPEGGGIFGRFFLSYVDEFYLLFRLIFAFLVSLHGAQKAFGLWGFPVPAPMPIVNVAGWVEIISALLIGFGVLTRLGAGALVVTMVIAYFMMHAPNGIWPHIFPNPPGGHGVIVRSQWRRGDNPVVCLRRHHWNPRQPQVGHRAACVQEGIAVGGDRAGTAVLRW